VSPSQQALQQAKQALREQMNVQLAAVGRRRAVAAGRQAAWRATRWPLYRRAGTVMAFLSTHSEIDTEPLIVTALADGKVVAVPRIVPGPERRLEVVRLRGIGDPTEPGPFSIREPVSGELLDPASVELVFVPGLAFDDLGGRLGHGGGYFDRLLAGPARGAARCAMGFELQVVEPLPMQGHDVRMQFILTEARLRRIAT
jgi:5-formyltetrahydrofolate cyclo-ligase